MGRRRDRRGRGCIQTTNEHVGSPFGTRRAVDGSSRRCHFLREVGEFDGVERASDLDGEWEHRVEHRQLASFNIDDSGRPEPMFERSVTTSHLVSGQRRLDLHRTSRVRRPKHGRSTSSTSTSGSPTSSSHMCVGSVSNRGSSNSVGVGHRQVVRRPQTRPRTRHSHLGAIATRPTLCPGSAADERCCGADERINAGSRAATRGGSVRRLAMRRCRRSRSS